MRLALRGHVQVAGLRFLPCDEGFQFLVKGGNLRAFGEAVGGEDAVHEVEAAHQVIGMVEELLFVVYTEQGNAAAEALETTAGGRVPTPDFP